MREKGLNNFFETSAKTGQNVNELFFALTKHLYLQNKPKLDLFVSFYPNAIFIERASVRRG